MKYSHFVDWDLFHKYQALSSENLDGFEPDQGMMGGMRTLRMNGSQGSIDLVKAADNVIGRITASFVNYFNTVFEQSIRAGGLLDMARHPMRNRQDKIEWKKKVTGLFNVMTEVDECSMIKSTDG